MNWEIYRCALDPAGAAIYDFILRGLQDRLSLIHIPLTSSSAVNGIFAAVLKDHPEIPWASGKWRGQPEATAAVSPVYTLSEEEIRAFQGELQIIGEAVRDMLRLPEAQRVRWAYDFLLENVIYDLSAPHSQDAYGALMEGRAVCRGIAKGLQLLLRCCGLEAFTVEGRLCENSLHVWNIVSLSGVCYHLDLTMGYPAFSFLYTDKCLPYDRYAAFCVSDESLRKTHAWDAEQTPIRCPRNLRK